jgi:rubrerythrin
MKDENVQELLYQALETERGGVGVYEMAVTCAQNDQLKKEWEEYLEQTRRHEQIVLDVLEQLGLDPTVETTGRQIVRSKAESLMSAMQTALNGGDPVVAQLVAAECVVEAETKDHMNWELIGILAEEMKGAEAKVLKDAHGEVEDEEDEHLYHTMGWARELWIESLGLPAVIPPPEEEKEVKTAIGAARAKLARKKML